MVLEGLRGYLALASGLTEVTRERVSALTDELLATSKSNRDLLVNLVRGEVERSVHRLGLVSAQELETVTRRADGLERRVAQLEGTSSSTKRTGAAKSTTKATKTTKSTRTPTRSVTAASSTSSTGGKGRP